jgi:ssDNA-binding Zn-finger/Zn-ribbon topoisomerase 1
MKKLLDATVPHPCPECGGKLILTKYIDNGRSMIKVECDKCHNFTVGSEQAFLAENPTLFHPDP